MRFLYEKIVREYARIPQVFENRDVDLGIRLQVRVPRKLEVVEKRERPYRGGDQETMRQFAGTLSSCCLVHTRFGFNSSDFEKAFLASAFRPDFDGLLKIADRQIDSPAERRGHIVIADASADIGRRQLGVALESPCDRILGLLSVAQTRQHIDRYDLAVQRAEQTMILGHVRFQRHGALRRPDSRLGRPLDDGLVALLLRHFRQVGIGQGRTILRGRVVRGRLFSSAGRQLLQRRTVLKVARRFQFRGCGVRDERDGNQGESHSSATRLWINRKYNPRRNSSIPFTARTTGAVNCGTSHPVSRLPIGIPPRNATL